MTIFAAHRTTLRKDKRPDRCSFCNRDAVYERGTADHKADRTYLMCTFHTIKWLTE